MVQCHTAGNAGGVMRFRRTLIILVLGTFIMVIVPVYLLSFYIFHRGYKMADQNVSETMYVSSYRFLHSFEEEVERVENLHQKYLNDDDIYYFVNAASILSRYDQTSRLMQIQDKLVQLGDSSTYIENVILWMPGCSKMISSGNGVQNITDDWKKMISEDPLTYEAGLIVVDNSLYLCSSYPIYGGIYESTPAYVLAIQLSNAEIRNSMNTMTAYENSGTVFETENKAFHLETGNIVSENAKVLQRTNLGRSYEASSSILKDERQDYFCVRLNSEKLGLTLETYTPTVELYSQIRSYQKMFILFTLAVLSLIAVYIVFAEYSINRPTKRLIQALNDVENGNLNVRIGYQGNDDFRVLYESFNNMTVSMKNMMEINARQQVLAKEAEYRQLQAQINPHFLYNSFFILYRMAKDEDYDNITTFLVYLADYYRYITRNESIESTLKEEDEHARRYVQIQLIRFRRKIQADFEELPPKFANMRVPRLIVQPLIENAFEHGVRDVVDGGRIHIWYEEDKEKNLWIRVEDNGSGMNEEDEQRLLRQLKSGPAEGERRTGIININQRIQLKYGNEYGVRFEKKEGKTCFGIVLPGKEERGREGGN